MVHDDALACEQNAKPPIAEAPTFGCESAQTCPHFGGVRPRLRRTVLGSMSISLQARRCE